jgi:hypothetical protein
MVCSPEISRMNGAKSRGAVTQRGKTIASRNATKHGLLAQKPPLLITEDLTTFEELVQGLIDYYQPESPVEHFLIQQVAMGMLKQYRLWNVEAAIANMEILAVQQKVKFPDVVTPPKLKLDAFNDYQEQRTPLKELLQKERGILERLIYDLDYDLAHLEKKSKAETLEAFRDSLGLSYFHENRSAEVYQYQDELNEWLCEICDQPRKKNKADLPEAIARVEKLLVLARQRMVEVKQPLAEMEVTDRAIAQAETASKGLQSPELFTRYQRNINRELYKAIDRLEAIQQQRNSGNSIGSFSQIITDEGQLNREL